jgi:hypothetical protein
MDPSTGEFSTRFSIRHYALGRLSIILVICSWDRQPYITYKGLLKDYDHIFKNFMLSNYDGQEVITTRTHIYMHPRACCIMC